MRIALTIQYDGTNYCGWQRQRNGLSIQEIMEDALCRAVKSRVPLTASGRTDAGVHACGQVAHFDTDSRIPPDRYPYVFNSLLPPDIRVLSSREVAPDFHARFSAKGKHYRYVIANRRFADVFNRTLCALESCPLRFDLMERAAAHFLGEHDFSAFCAAGAQHKGTSVRRIDRSELAKDGDVITFDVYGNGFLYNMVRIMAGTLTDVGKLKIDPDSIPEILRQKKREYAGTTAPAKGLFLAEVFY